MTKKDYERAAAIVRNILSGHTRVEAALVAVSFEMFFQGDNPNFDPAKWRKACFGELAVKPTPVTPPKRKA